MDSFIRPLSSWSFVYVLPIIIYYYTTATSSSVSGGDITVLILFVTAAWSASIISWRKAVVRRTPTFCCGELDSGVEKHARVPVMTTPNRPLVVRDVLSRNRPIVTRLQDLRIRRTFRFLDLPAELRNIIYDLCLSFKGIETFFDTYYADLRKAGRARGVEPPTRRIRTPAIFLLCKQTYAEASVLLRKQGVVFTHGLLDIQGVTELVSENVIRNLGSITINVKGHPIMNRKLLFESWTGHMDLLSEMATILSKGHKLKKLVLDFEDEDLAVHTKGCWYGENRCDFRDNLKEALGKLRAVRSVPCVEIIGIDERFAQVMKKRMQSKPLSFLDLPGEIRNAIYKYSADFSSITPAIKQTITTWTDRTQRPTFPHLTTPSILLINKQITAEATSILYAHTTLHITLPFDLNMRKEEEIPCLTHFISTPTLQKIQHLHIDVRGWEWMHGLKHAFRALARKHALRSFRLCFKDNLKTTFLMRPMLKYPDKILQLNLRTLPTIRGVPSVIIKGDLPEVYSRPLAQIMMTAPWINNIPKLQAVLGNGTVVDADFSVDY